MENDVQNIPEGPLPATPSSNSCEPGSAGRASAPPADSLVLWRSSSGLKGKEE